MIFKDQYSVSFWHKTVFSVLVVITVLACIQAMFPNISPASIPGIRFSETGNLLRRILITSILIIYFLRLQVTVWAFQKRKWTWPETIIISLVMPWSLYIFVRFGGSNVHSVGAIEIMGVLLYLAGSYMNTRSEYDRYIWKKKNRGHIYTEGLFKYSMHINYFGDSVLFTGFAMVTGSVPPFIVPFIMTTNFILAIIPLLDDYLEKKYGMEFSEYASRAKKFIPFIY